MSRIGLNISICNKSLQNQIELKLFFSCFYTNKTTELVLFSPFFSVLLFFTHLYCYFQSDMLFHCKWKAIIGSEQKIIDIGNEGCWYWKCIWSIQLWTQLKITKMFYPDAYYSFCSVSCKLLMSICCNTHWNVSSQCIYLYKSLWENLVRFTAMLFQLVSTIVHCCEQELCELRLLLLILLFRYDQVQRWWWWW